ncbi:hypothetical protein R6L23_16840 [Streptomyces sp. SR27]|nr:hypothetical protein [Streptomyces sp. SR27]MDV9189863.1 hypothetical protein [Streptomyces sp. SR27]
MESNAQRPETQETAELHQADTAGTPELETDGLVFKRELLNEFLGNRVRS